MPKPRFDFRDINKERLKKISLSCTSLPPVALFPTEEKTSKLEAITFHSDDNINDDQMYNNNYFFDDDDYDEDKIPELRHPSLEFFDDFYPIDEQHMLDLLDEDDSGQPQMTTTTTIASFKCQSQTPHYQQQTSVTIYQTHNRASSL